MKISLNFSGVSMLLLMALFIEACGQQNESTPESTAKELVSALKSSNIEALKDMRINIQKVVTADLAAVKADSVPCRKELLDFADQMNKPVDSILKRTETSMQSFIDNKLYEREQETINRVFGRSFDHILQTGIEDHLINWAEVKYIEFNYEVDECDPPFTFQPMVREGRIIIEHKDQRFEIIANLVKYENTWHLIEMLHLGPEQKEEPTTNK
ncbi:MAG: hypothetical protein K9G67_09120 [Bacteroidales bacterium]|nr:hypothetical protein [Bacteroidales bacterium]MCF8343136.1 hypothetical protein [Bacteroidales bacterium]MCF8351545.1 hypothetical protein [Bacteroidales bacterium]MCF8376502.1 hypothetical protein [Bacteroidales bacterium]MCF8401504.1 hypothetical protein [Bacteroidales bacterium]